MLDTHGAAENLEVRAGFKPYVVADKPSISIVGLGYVGSVTAGCLAAQGHRIVGIDLDPRKIASVAAGRSPIHEEGLNALLADGVDRGAIAATQDLQDAVRRTDVTFVSVGTPTAPDGSCDLRYIEQVADGIGEALAGKSGFHVVVLRCSVPPGTTMGVMAPRIEKRARKVLGLDFGVAFVPEFLREGVAVEDFHNPPKTVIGASDARTSAIVSRIFDAIDPTPVLTQIETAELVKYVDNVWHATKVCFANEVGRLSKAVDVDGREVMEIFCRDTKLNLSPYYLKPGFAYGGSCLPKEVRAVVHLAGDRNVDLPLIESLGRSNALQVDAAVNMILSSRPRRVGVLGLAFKPGTNDLRESPILDVMARLESEGLTVRGHDFFLGQGDIADSARQAGAGKPALRDLCDRLPGLLFDNPAELLEQVDAVIVTHDLPEYREILKDCAKPVVDVARLFDREEAPSACHGIGW